MPTDSQIDSLAHVPRCMSCGYVLQGLESRRCPECGREFDPNDPRTFSDKPPYLPTRYWFPGLVMAAVVTVVMGVGLVAAAGYGVAVSIVLPICFGTVLGYGVRGGVIRRILLSIFAVLVLLGLAFTLFSLSFAGVFCGVSLFFVMLVPTAFGLFLGSMLRWYLKSTRWDQRWHLPALMLVLVPLLVAGIERVFFPHPYAVEEVRTAVDVPVGSQQAWDGVMFYEQVKLPQPWLLRWFLPKPLYTTGSADKVGDRKVCVYSHGRLVKSILEVIPGRRLDFAVVEQTHVENRSVRLIGGSFIFEPIDDHHTRITLSTRYEPLLSPRFAWRPFETLGMSTLHRFVLKGMALKAEECQPANAAGVGR